MRLTAKVALILILLPLSLLGLGCATSSNSTPAVDVDPTSTVTPSPNQRLYNTYGRALEIGAAIYEESMISAGEAHARGTITDEELARVRESGLRVETALKLAKSSLTIYVASQGQNPSVNLSAQFAAFQEALTSLTRLLIDKGVTK